jgi:4-hydroxybenzoate polyprenyltransferase
MTITNLFSHLPSYHHPRTGLLSKLPHKVIPYAELTRIDRPAGWCGVNFPFLIGLIYAGCISGDSEASDSLTLGSLAIRFIPFSMLLRSAACTWNGTVDQKFDRRVARTRHRPVARRAVSTNQALIFTFVQTTLAVMAARALLPQECASHAWMMVALAGVYSLMKRITHYPQIVLGILCAWPILFASSAIGISPVRAPTLALFGSILAWSVINDAFYAFQDIADDEKAGVKSMSLKFKDIMPLVSSRQWCSTFRKSTYRTQKVVGFGSRCNICWSDLHISGG